MVIDHQLFKAGSRHCSFQELEQRDSDANASDRAAIVSNSHTLYSLSAVTRLDDRNACAVFMIRMSHSTYQEAICGESPTQATVASPLIRDDASIHGVASESHSTLPILAIARIASPPDSWPQPTYHHRQ
jgi:hypothetical protein